MNGWVDLKRKVETTLEGLDAAEGTEIANRESLSLNLDTTDVLAENEVNISSTSNSSSSRTSQDTSSDVDSTTSGSKED